MAQRLDGLRDKEKHSGKLLKPLVFNLWFVTTSKELLRNF